VASRRHGGSNLLTTIVLAGALLASPQAGDKWDIKAGLAPKSSTTWNVTTNVVMGGDQHTATMKFLVATNDKDADKPLKGTVSWKDLTIESGQSMGDSDWDVTYDPHGLVADTTASDGADTVQKLLTPFMFAYPDAAVGVGDTWSATIKGGTDKDDRSITEDMKVDSMDKVGDADVLKVTETLSQKGADGLKGTGTWWVDKTGKILKFQVHTTNWEVPMVPGQMLDADITAEIAK